MNYELISIFATKLNVTMHTSDSIVIIPTYNEKENIEKIIRAVFGLEKCFHILIQLGRVFSSVSSPYI